MTKGGTKGGGKGGTKGGSGKGEGKRVRKGPRSGEGGMKRIWLPGAVLDMREDRSQVGGVQRLRGWRRGAASGCGRGDHGGGALDRGQRAEDAKRGKGGRGLRRWRTRR